MKNIQSILQRKVTLATSVKVFLLLLAISTMIVYLLVKYLG